MKKISLTVFVILSMVVSTTAISFASLENNCTIYDSDILEKYETVYEELETRLEESIESNYNIVEVRCLTESDRTDNANELPVLTESFIEGDAIVTLGVAASTVTQTIPEQQIFSHAKLYIKTTLSKRSTASTTYYSVKKVEGRVVELYDGAQCTKISINVGQSTPGINDRTNSFSVNSSSYSKSYSWPEIELTDFTVIGHNSYFTIVRGSSTQQCHLIANL